jgi:DnaJ-class molecular chaperone
MSAEFKINDTVFAVVRIYQSCKSCAGTGRVTACLPTDHSRTFETSCPDCKHRGHTEVPEFVVRTSVLRGMDLNRVNELQFSIRAPAGDYILPHNRVFKTKTEAQNECKRLKATNSLY